jgi:hypothetical protein
MKGTMRPSPIEFFSRKCRFSMGKAICEDHRRGPLNAKRFSAKFGKVTLKEKMVPRLQYRIDVKNAFRS